MDDRRRRVRQNSDLVGCIDGIYSRCGHGGGSIRGGQVVIDPWGIDNGLWNLSSPYGARPSRQPDRVIIPGSGGSIIQRYRSHVGCRSINHLYLDDQGRVGRPGLRFQCQGRCRADDLRRSAGNVAAKDRSTLCIPVDPYFHLSLYPICNRIAGTVLHHIVIGDLR
ncbi:MAG: hypothetical protein BWY83_00024 [bacterium ADurb.Bin478]|nr:MAG: hypothetical protein BWY83_00024 [bacterium ADurb.Bin478]